MNTLSFYDGGCKYEIENWNGQYSITRIETDNVFVSIPAYATGPMFSKPILIEGINIWTGFPKCVRAVHVPENIKKIWNGFANTNIETISGCEGLVEIGTGAFRGLKIEKFVCSDTVRIIDDCAFMDCKYLREFVGGYGVWVIGNRAFEGSAVESLTSFNNLKSIGSYAFKDCTNLKDLFIGSGVSAIGENIFSGLTQFHYSFNPLSGNISMLEKFKSIPTRQRELSHDRIWNLNKEIVLNDNLSIAFGWPKIAYDENEDVELPFAINFQKPEHVMIYANDLEIERFDHTVDSLPDRLYDYYGRNEVEIGKIHIPAPWGKGKSSFLMHFDFGIIRPYYRNYLLFRIYILGEWVQHKNQWLLYETGNIPLLKEEYAKVGFTDIAPPDIDNDIKKFKEIVVQPITNWDFVSNTIKPTYPNYQPDNTYQWDHNKSKKDWDYDDNDISSWSDESILHQNGYTVSQQAGLTRYERQAILSRVIDSGIMSPRQVKRFIELQVQLRRGQYRFETAIGKWEDDISFIEREYL